MDKLENPTPEDMKRMKIMPPLEPTDMAWLEHWIHTYAPACDERTRVLDAVGKAKPFIEVAEHMSNVFKILTMIDLVRHVAQQEEEAAAMVPRKGGIN
jgi:hypothetical protein